MMLPDARLDHLAELYIAMAARNPIGWACPTFEEYLWLAHERSTQKLLLDYSTATYMEAMGSERRGSM